MSALTMIRIIRTLVCCLGLAGCASGLPVPDVVRVQVPTVCIESVPTKPAMLSDAQLLALDDYALIIALAQDRRVRQGWEATIEALVAGCR